MIERLSKKGIAIFSIAAAAGYGACELIHHQNNTRPTNALAAPILRTPEVPAEADFSTYQAGSRIDEVYSRDGILYRSYVLLCDGKNLVETISSTDKTSQQPNSVHYNSSQVVRIWENHRYCADQAITERDFTSSPPKAQTLPA